MSKKRVYRVVVAGKERFVEANSGPQAQHHIGEVERQRVTALIESCDSASAIAISQFVRGGGDVETAGEMPRERGRSFLVAENAREPGAGLEPPTGDGC